MTVNIFSHILDLVKYKNVSDFMVYFLPVVICVVVQIKCAERSELVQDLEKCS